MATPEVMGATQSKSSLAEESPEKTMIPTGSGDEAVTDPPGGANGSFELGQNSLLADDTDNDSLDEGGLENSKPPNHNSNRGISG